ncbi:MAG: hypothetical protein ACI4KM_06435 [Oscillospiraceae bacterium]
MKRIIPVAAFLGLLLCGCASGNPFTSPKPDFDKAYSADAQIKYDGNDAKAEIVRNSAGDWQFCFSEPEALNGIKLNLTADGMSATLGGLNVSAEPSSVYTTIPEIIADSLDTLPAVDSESITENEGVLTIETELNSRRVTVTADNSGRLISLKCPYHKLSVYFSNQENNKASVGAETTESDEGSISLE